MAHTATSILLQLRDARGIKKGIASDLKFINERIARLVAQSIEELEGLEMKTVTIESDEGSYRCSRTMTEKATVVDDMAFREWMHNEDESMALVQSIHAGKLTSWWRERKDLGENLPDGVDSYIVENISITKV